jgi:hypothetical protein
MRAFKSSSQPHRSEVLKELLRRCLTLTYNAMDYGIVNQKDDRRAMMGNRTTPVILGVDAGKLPSTEDATEPHHSSRWPVGPLST